MTVDYRFDRDDVLDEMDGWQLDYTETFLAPKIAEEARQRFVIYSIVVDGDVLEARTIPVSDDVYHITGDECFGGEVYESDADSYGV